MNFLSVRPPLYLLTLCSWWISLETIYQCPFGLYIVISAKGKQYIFVGILITTPRTNYDGNVMFSAYLSVQMGFLLVLSLVLSQILSGERAPLTGQGDIPRTWQGLPPGQNRGMCPLNKTRVPPNKTGGTPNSLPQRQFMAIKLQGMIM